jgi:hypothetical protein
MPQIANSYTEFTRVRQREQLMDKIWNVSVDETPSLALMGKEKVSGVFVEWLTDEFRAAASNRVEVGNAATVVARVAPLRYGNRTQISEDVFSITGTQQWAEKAGPASEVAHQEIKTMVALKKDIEFGCLQNTTAIPAAAGTAPQARGLPGFIATNTDIGGGAGANANALTNTAPVDGSLRQLAEAQLQAVLKKLFDAGAPMRNLYILLPSDLRARFDTFLAGQTRFDKSEDKTLTATLEVYIGPFGRVKAVNARHMRQRDVFIIEPEYVALGTGRPMKSEKLGVRGDAQEYMVNCEWTLIVKNERAHGKIADVQPGP